MKSMLEAQKAVAHLRYTRETGEEEECCGRKGDGSFCGKLTACPQYAGSAEGCKAVEDSRENGRPRKPVEGVADAEDPETVEGVKGADDPEWQWQATGSRGLC